uniref:Uncharacterized protein n=1 Tax=Mucochytrium quahogii TaxID=96639 RepID=A0A7S2R6G3_9STRA
MIVFTESMPTQDKRCELVNSAMRASCTSLIVEDYIQGSHSPGAGNAKSRLKSEECRADLFLISQKWQTIGRTVYRRIAKWERARCAISLYYDLLMIDDPDL